MKGRPLVIGHRGASAAFPENTVEAFRGAKALGADWVELDVRRTADGVLVIHHDPLPRGARPDAVPTLDQALDACLGMGVNVEIKHDDADPERTVAAATAERLVALAGEGAGPVVADLLVSSFDPRTLEVVRERRPELATAALAHVVDDLEHWLDGAVAAGHVGVNPWDGIVDAALVDGAHRRGLRVHVWTVDDSDRMRALAALGVDGIITNVPDVARATLDA
jgi:glycerophosphoryl diester phosphodiesterase